METKINLKINFIKTEIKSIDFTSKQELKDFVYENANTLFRFYSEVIGIEIFLRHANSHTDDNKMCQIRLVIPGKRYPVYRQE